MNKKDTRDKNNGDIEQKRFRTSSEDLPKPTEHKGPRVTVLVPVYNTSKYLTQCMQSLCNQILDDMEILCLNDGSTDNSLDILENFAKKDSRIRIINKKNTGYGDTMNKGILHAKGEYIGIVESDDFVDPDMFIELYSLAKKHDADVVRCNYFEYRDGNDIIHPAVLPEETGFLVDLVEDVRILYQAPAIWAGLYRRDFLIKEKLFFLPTPGASYQDASFNFKTLIAAKNLVFTDKPYLHYRRDNETSSVKSDQKVYCINDEYAEIEKYLKKKDKWKTFGYTFEAVKFAGYHWNLLRLPKDKLEPFLLRMRAEFHDADNQKMLKRSYFPKNHWRALRLLLDISPKAFLLVFNTYQKKKKKNL